MSKAKQSKSYTMTEKVGRYPSATASWYLVSINQTVGQEIYETYGQKQRGFGSLPVEVTLGMTTWTTSIFRDSRTKSYILFLKAAVRKKEDIEVGDIVTISITLVQ